MVWEDYFYIGFLLWLLFSSIEIPDYHQVMILCERMYHSCYFSRILFSCFPMSWECMTHPFFQSRFASVLWTGGIWGICSVLVGELSFRKVILQSVKLCCDSSTLRPRRQGLSSNGMSRNPEEREVYAFGIKNLQTRHFALSLTYPFSLVAIQTALN